jgi:hypothetical protein
MNNISTIDLLDDPANLASDMQAVQEFAEKGAPIDPAALARIRARANRVREGTRLRHGIVNIDEFRRHTTDEDE